jgi:predicted CoA-binding protein
MAALELIQDFLRQKRPAIVGVWRNPKDFSRMLFREFLERGYDPVPVNPQVEEVEGRRCFGRLRDIQPPVEAALLMTSPRLTETIAADCAEAGVKQVWMYRAIGLGAINPQAVALCHEKGISVIEGYCPLMSLPKTPFVHRLRGLFMKLTGSYPR